MAIRTDFIRKAYNENRSKYKNVNNFKARAYSDLDNYYTGSVNNIDKAYGTALSSLDEKLKSKKEKLDFDRRNAYSDYTSALGTAEKKYKAYSNENGAFKSSLADKGLSQSGYAEELKAEGFEEKQHALSSAAFRLQQGISQLEQEYAAAVSENADAKAQLTLQKMNDLQSLLSDVYSKLGQISSDIYNMDYNERSLSK